MPIGSSFTQSGSRNSYNGSTPTRLSSTRAVTIRGAPVPNCRHHANSHKGDWNGVASGMRRHSAAHSGTSAATPSSLSMCSIRTEKPVREPQSANVLPDRIVSTSVQQKLAPGEGRNPCPRMLNHLMKGSRPSPGPLDDCGQPSAVQPPIFHAPAIVLAVDHDRRALHLRLPAGRGAEVVDDRPRAILLQFPVDVPDQALALFLVGFCRLLLEQFFELGVAIAGVVALRAAAVILIELLVRVVDATAGVVHADLVVVPRHLGEPVGGVDRFELAIDPDRLQLVDQDHRRIAKDRDVTG